MRMMGPQPGLRVVCLMLLVLMVDPVAASGTEAVRMERIQPDKGGGIGYRLTYLVDAPIQVFWRFKTDFDNTFLVDNRFIREHRLVSRSDGIAITEDKYTYGPDGYFRWQTTLDERQYRLDFILINPKVCRQDYHYGHIQLTPDGTRTRVVQEAYFDFLGATLWAYYPWRGGLKAMLTETARWEQATILRLRSRYDHESDRK